MISFGTGGWRAIIGDDFTKENVRKLMFALAQRMKREDVADKSFCIGYDRRFLSREAAEWAAEVMAGGGIHVLMINREAPTPLIMFTVQYYGLDYGIAVTASHNPALYNGIKLFTKGGRDAVESVTNELGAAANDVDPKEIHSIEYKRAIAAGLVQEINPQKAGYRPGTPRRTRRITQAEIVRAKRRRRLLGALGVLAVLLLRSLGVFGTPTTAQTTPTPTVSVATPAPTETPTPTPTPKPEPTYEVVTADVSWADAEAAAEAKGGHLVVIDSAEKWTRVAQLADESGLTYVWIGLHRTDSGELAWVRDNVDPVYNWASGEPSVHDTNGAAEDYVLITRTNSGWYYNDCIGDPAGRYPQFYSGKIGYIIEIDP